MAIMQPPAAPMAEPSATRPFGLGKLGDFALRTLSQGAALFVVATAVLLLIVIVYKAWLSIDANGFSFFTDKVWDPAQRVFGSLAFVYGTLVSSALAMFIAVPLGIGTAAFLSEIAPHWMRRVGSFMVEMLAAVPSVVYGFWAMFVLGPQLQKFVTALGGPNFGGIGLFPAGIVLAIMIVPYITAVSYDVCRAVPGTQREGALALGATRWQMIWSVVLPYARPGITGACFLALGRALGETMAVTMIIGNNASIDFSIFAKADTIASVIANQFAEASFELHQSALVELGLVLFLVTVIVNSLARLLIWRVGKVGGNSGVTGWFWSLPSRAFGLATGVFSGPAMAATINRVMTVMLGLCLVITVGTLILILGYLVFQGVSALNLDFFVNLPRAPGQEGGGMVNALAYSGVLVGVASLIAVPIGLLAAIYLTEYRDRFLAPTVRFIGELLGGVPSIVIGIFAYSLVVGAAEQILGRRSLFGWAGAFALAVMMIPIVMRASEEALKLVPQSLRHASLALGARNWQTIIRVTVPAALPAIITAVFLAIARIVGETAPLLLTAGTNRFWPDGLSDFTPSLPVFIFNYANSPDPEWNRQAWAAAFVLLTLVMFLNFGIRFMTGKRNALAGRFD